MAASRADFARPCTAGAVRDALNESSSRTKLDVAARSGRPLSDRDVLRLVSFENGERVLGVVDRLEAVGDLTARDEVIRGGFEGNGNPLAGLYPAMRRLLWHGRYLDAMLLRFDFERVAAGVDLPRGCPDPFKAAGTLGTPEQVMEVLDFLRDRDRPRDAHAVVAAVTRRRDQPVTVVPLVLLALSALSVFAPLTLRGGLLQTMFLVLILLCTSTSAVLRPGRVLVSQRRHRVWTQDHERAFQGRHHGKGEPVDLKTERDVIRMDSLAHPLRQFGGGARLGSAAEELGSIRPTLGSPPSDVLSTRQIFIGLPIVASDHERDTVTLARPQEPSRCLRHHEAGTQHQRRILDRKGADCPCRGFLHNGPSAKVNGPQQARRVDGVEPGRGRTVLERHPIRVASLERQGFVQRLGKNDLFRPLGKCPGSHGESTHDVDHDRHGRVFDQIGDTKETSVHSGHDRACPTRGTRRVIGIASTVSECTTSGCLRATTRPGAGSWRQRKTPPLWWTDGVDQAVPSHLRLRRT